MGVVDVRDRQKVDIFGKKSGGTPNRRVKKLGLTSNPHKFFALAGAVRAPADAKNFWGLGVIPNFLTQGLGVPPLFLPKKSTFRRKPRFRSKSLQKKVNPLIILIPFYFFRSPKHIENPFTFFRGGGFTSLQPPLRANSDNQIV